jgi:hypothetical protein
MIRKVLALGLMVGLTAGIGCGGRMSTVEGKVTLDGTPVEGASVSFVPEDAKGQPANGITDASGTFTLKTGTKSGVAPGNYKVVVVKTPQATGFDPGKMKPGSPEAQEEMKKNMAKMGPGTGGKASGPQGPKNELPEKYSDASKTPLKATVPLSERPYKADLTSK